MGRSWARLSGSPSTYDKKLIGVKYYNSSGQYQICFANYHNSTDILSWDAGVFWKNNSGTVVVTDSVAQPAPGAIGCTPWRALHADPNLQVETQPGGFIWYITAIPW